MCAFIGIIIKHIAFIDVSENYFHCKFMLLGNYLLLIFCIVIHCCSLILSVVLLQEKKLLELPKLLDICAIYHHENEELTRSLVRISI